MPVDHRPQFRKTMLCVYHRQGHCTWGSECNHAHSEDELREIPNLYKTSLCRRYKAGACGAGEYCQFAHGRAELRSTAAFLKTRLCSHGFECADPHCRYAHDPSELRARPHFALRVQNGGAGGAAPRGQPAGGSTNEDATTASRPEAATDAHGETPARARRRARRREQREAAPALGAQAALQPVHTGGALATDGTLTGSNGAERAPRRVPAEPGFPAPGAAPGAAPKAAPAELAGGDPVTQDQDKTQVHAEQQVHTAGHHAPPFLPNYSTWVAVPPGHYLVPVGQAPFQPNIRPFYHGAPF